jgi:hypothetical protein
MYLARYTEPKLTGVVVKEAVRCGKKNCRCTQGEFHKWYYYLYYRSFENDAWKLKKEYIKRNKVKYLKAKIKVLKNKDMGTKVRLSANMSLLKDTFGYVKGSISANDLLKSIYEIA